MENRVITGVIGVFVVICLVGTALVPLIDSWAKGESETNEGAGWLRMEYASSAPTQIYIRANIGDEGLTVERETVNPDVTETQTGQDDTIIYASSNLAVWMEDGLLHILGQKEDGTPFYVQPSSLMVDLPFGWSAQRINYDENEDAILIPAPSWAYIPKSSGNYAFFNAGDAVKMESDKPTAVIGGGVASVYAYNDIIRYAGLGLQFVPEYDESDKLIGASWIRTAAELTSVPFDPSTITIQPLDPSILDPQPDAAIMSVPTPSYTEGDWGYDIASIDGVDKALIVSYSGPGGDIVVPATIGGYDVYCFGKSHSGTGGANAEVFDNTTISTSSLTLSEGIKEVGAGACRSISNITSITLPQSLKVINGNAFYSSGITGHIEIPDSVTTIGGSAFRSTLISSINLPNGLTSIETSAFQGCSNLSEVNLPAGLTSIGAYAFRSSGITTAVIPESVTSIGAYAFDGCSHLTNLIVSSNATPSSNSFGNGSNTPISLIVDLSQDVDYTTNKYGAPASAAVSETIGSAFGYISFVEIGSDPILPEGAAALMVAIPVVIFAALIAVGAAIFIRVTVGLRLFFSKISYISVYLPYLVIYHRRSGVFSVVIDANYHCAVPYYSI